MTAVAHMELNTRNVYKIWRWLNEYAFGGQLPQPKIAINSYLYIKDGDKKTPLAGCYSGVLNELRLSAGGEAVKPLTMENVETLYHEMVHQFGHEVMGNIWGAHGNNFHQAYREGLERLQKRLK